MKREEIFGWVLFFSGILILISPYISGATGFFYTLYGAVPPVSGKIGFGWPMLIVGTAFIIVGYYLMKTKMS